MPNKNWINVAKSENKQKMEDLANFAQKNRKSVAKSEMKRKLKDLVTFAKKIE